MRTASSLPFGGAGSRETNRYFPLPNKSFIGSRSEKGWST